MKLRFSLRKLFLLPLVFGIVLASVVWILDQRQRGADVLNQTLGKHGCPGRGGIISGATCSIPIFVPTWRGRVLGSTSPVVESVCFMKTEIEKVDCRLFSRSIAAQEVTSIMFDKTTLTNASYFPAHWHGVRSLSFVDVKLPEEWKAALCKHQHVDRGSIGLSVDDIKALSHLKILVLSNLGFSQEELIEIRTALPNTKVVVVAHIGERSKWKPSELTRFAGPKLTHYRNRSQELQQEVAKSRLPPFVFQRERSISAQELLAFEKKVGIYFSHSIGAFLLARQQRLIVDPMFEMLTERPPKVVTFQSKEGVTFTEMYVYYLDDYVDFDFEYYFNGLQIGNVDGQPLWVGLENGELFVGKASSVVVRTVSLSNAKSKLVWPSNSDSFGSFRSHSSCDNSCCQRMATDPDIDIFGFSEGE